MIVTYQNSNITVNKSASQDFINKRQDESVKIQNDHKNDLEPPPSKKKKPKKPKTSHIGTCMINNHELDHRGFLFFGSNDTKP